MAETIAESARKASAGSWRKPRMKIYDYNQVSYFFTYSHIYLIFLQEWQWEFVKWREYELLW